MDTYNGTTLIEYRDTCITMWMKIHGW